MLFEGRLCGLVLHDGDLIAWPAAAGHDSRCCAGALQALGLMLLEKVWHLASRPLLQPGMTADAVQVGGRV
jgi:hypothetical protein